MGPIKVMTVVGARPQLVKAAVVSRALVAAGGIEEVVVHTGQHFDSNMSDIFFDELSMPVPRYNLGIHGLSHGAMTGRMVEAIEKLILSEKPDLLMVYGDTDSTLAGSLAASKIHVPLLHVESGLRSFNWRMPEEINRVLTDRLSQILCCPTDQAVKNLIKEGYSDFPTKVFKTGDVMLDAVQIFRSAAEKKSRILDALALSKGPFILATVHRAENTASADHLREIFSALDSIHESVPVVCPLHPRTRKAIESWGINTRIKLIDPVGYLDMLKLLGSSSLVLTDSGGLQKEAYWFGKPCITLRNETEWTELVECGANRLAGPSRDKIIDSYQSFRNVDIGKWPQDLYGSGQASELIATLIKKYFKRDEV